MSEQLARTPDQFVKRAPTVSETMAKASTVGNGMLAAYYVNECIAAGHFVKPSNEMVIMGCTLLFPFAHGIYLVARKRFDNWMAEQGVQPQ